MLQKLTAEAAEKVEQQERENLHFTFGTVEERTAAYKDMLALQSGGVAQELEDGMKRINQNRQALNTALAEVEDCKRKYAEVKAEAASSEIALKYYQMRAEGQKVTTQWTKDAVRDAAGRTISAEVTAAQKIATEGVKLFGMTLTSWEQKDAGAEAAVQSLKQVEKRCKDELGDAESEADRLQEWIKAEQSRNIKAVEDSQVKEMAMNQAICDFQNAVNICEEDKKALKDLVEKYPGLSPEAIVNLDNGIKLLTDISNKVNLGKGFQEKAIEMVKSQQEFIEELHNVTNADCIEDFKLKIELLRLRNECQ